MALPLPVEPQQFEALRPGAAPSANVFVCALCGGRFTHAEKACGSCPMNRGCEVVRCPNCGYQFPRESAVLSWLARLWRRRLPPAEGS